jgi:hypothetical protein
MRLGWGFGFAACVALGTEPSLAQVTAGSQQATRFIAGVVRDEQGRPLEYAQVVLDPTGVARTIRAGAGGRFRIIDVARGPHELRVSWLGYEPYERTLVVEQSITNLSIVLHRLTVALDEVTVTATRTGVWGTVISADTFEPVEGAVVDVLGDRRWDTTAADGRFALPSARSGPVMVRAWRPGYQRTARTVMLPRDGGVEVDLVIDTTSRKESNSAQLMWRDAELRHRWRGAGSVVITREELLRGGGDFVTAVLRSPSAIAAGFRGPTGCVTINYSDGRPSRRLFPFEIHALPLEQIEAVELFHARADWSRTTCATPFQQVLRHQHEHRPPGATVVWVRR